MELDLSGNLPNQGEERERMVPTTPRHWRKRLPQDAAHRFNGFRFAIPDYKHSPLVDEFFQTDKEEEINFKKSLGYKIESELDVWDLVICIEHCFNCEHHGSSLRHDPQKYENAAIGYQKALAHYMFNAGYSVRVGVVRCHITHESRVGAFEIDVYCRTRVTYAHVKLFSKLLSREWPSKRTVESELGKFLTKLRLPKWKTSQGITVGMELSANSEVVSFPAEYGDWFDMALAQPDWKNPPVPSNCFDRPTPQVPTLALGRSGNISSPGIGTGGSPAKTKTVSFHTEMSIEWVYDRRQHQPFHPVVGAPARVAGIPTPLGGLERLSLLGVVKHSDVIVPGLEDEAYVRVKLKYVGTEHVVSVAKCCELSEYIPLRSEYGHEEFPEELALVLLLVKSSRIRKTSNAMTSPTNSDEQSLSPVSASGSRASRKDWVAMTAYDKVVFDKVFLSRSSLFIQLREMVAQLESIVIAKSSLNGLIYHPISGNMVDLQQSYSEEVLNWLYSRFSIADMYQLEDVVERLYLMAVDEFVNCLMDPSAPKYAYTLQCFLLRHCIRERWSILSTTNYFYRKLVDNTSSLLVQESIDLMVKFLRSSLRDVCEVMATMRQRPDDWPSRIPYIVGSLDSRAQGAFDIHDLRSALEFISMPEILMTEENMRAVFLSIDTSAIGEVGNAQLQHFLECDNTYKRELGNLRSEIRQHLNSFVITEYARSAGDASPSVSPASPRAGGGPTSPRAARSHHVVLMDLFCDTLFKLVLTGITANLQVGWEHDRNFFLTGDTFIKLLMHFGFDKVCTEGDLQLLLWTYSHMNLTHHLYVNISDINRSGDKIVCWMNFLTWLQHTESEPYAAVCHRLLARAVLLQTNELAARQQELSINWKSPTDVPYGTPLSEVQLDARVESVKIAGVSSLTEIEGVYRYTPSIGEILDAGIHVLRCVFVPADLTKYQLTEKTVAFTVTKLNPTLSWVDIGEVTCGHELGNEHLCAVCEDKDISGTFYYSKTFGHVFPDPGHYDIVATFIPDNPNYSKAEIVKTLLVVPPDNGRKEAAIVWDNAEHDELRVGEELSERHLHAYVADREAEGKFFYSRSYSHTFLQPGEFEVTATFVPNEKSAKRLRKASKSVIIRVVEAKIKTLISWGDLPQIVYGTPLSELHLNASCIDEVHHEAVEGYFEYSVELGTILPAGSHVITVNFTPRKREKFEACSKSLPIKVTQKSANLTWSEPTKKEIHLDEELSDLTLNACCLDDIPGHISYTPSFGHLFPKPGTYQVQAVFVPVDRLNYALVSKSIDVRVTKPRPIQAKIICVESVEVVFGDNITEEMLNCRLVVESSDEELEGKFVFSPSLAELSNAAGEYIVLVNFISTDHSIVLVIQPVQVTVTVGKATPEIDWDDHLGSLFVGDPISTDHLCAQCITPNISGKFFYSKEAGMSYVRPGTHEITVTFVPDSPFDCNFTTVTKTAYLEVFAGSVDFIITWEQPEPIAFGTALSDTQLNPVVVERWTKEEVPGKFEFDPPSGTVLSAGRHTMQVTFYADTPATHERETPLVPIVKTVKLTVNKVIPTIVWRSVLPPLLTGEELPSDYFDASCPDVTGQFNYSVPEGHVFTTEGIQNIVVAFQPDSNDFTRTTKSATLEIIAVKIQSSVDIMWRNPSKIRFGTPLSTLQLNAQAVTVDDNKSVVDGSFEYDPPIGTVLQAGLHELMTTFHPADPKQFQLSSVVTLEVLKVAPTVEWDDPTEPLVVGQELTEQHLCARCLEPDIHGVMFYSRSLGYQFSKSGIHEIKATFVPLAPFDNNFSTSSKSVWFTVNDKIPLETQLIWDQPLPIVYGTPLTHIQLNAVVVYTESKEYVSGTFKYKPDIGTILNAGFHQLVVVFTYSDFDTYPMPLTAIVKFEVTPATPTLTWRPNPKPLLVGHPLTDMYLNAICNEGISGSFLYDPTFDNTFEAAGIHSINVIFFPAKEHEENYRQAAMQIKLAVLEEEKASLSITAELTWHQPKDIYLGTVLSEAQLSAVCCDRDNATEVEGTYTYTPPLGAKLPEGKHLLRVIFTPNRELVQKYGEIYSAEVSINVIDKKKLPHLKSPAKEPRRGHAVPVSTKPGVHRTMVFHRMVINSKVLKNSKFGDMEVSLCVSGHELSPVEMLDIVDRVNGTVNFYCQSRFLDLTLEEFMTTHLILSMRGHSMVEKKKVEFYCSVSVPLTEFLSVAEGPFTISLVAYPKLFFPSQGLAASKVEALNQKCKMQIAIVAHAYEVVAPKPAVGAISSELDSSANITNVSTSGVTKKGIPTKLTGSSSYGTLTPKKTTPALDDAPTVFVPTMGDGSLGAYITHHTADSQYSLYPFKNTSSSQSHSSKPLAADLVNSKERKSSQDGGVMFGPGDIPANPRTAVQQPVKRPGTAPARAQQQFFADTSARAAGVKPNAVDSVPGQRSYRKQQGKQHPPSVSSTERSALQAWTTYNTASSALPAEMTMGSTPAKASLGTVPSRRASNGSIASDSPSSTIGPKGSVSAAVSPMNSSMRKLTVDKSDKNKKTTTMEWH